MRSKSLAPTWLSHLNLHGFDEKKNKDSKEESKEDDESDDDDDDDSEDDDEDEEGKEKKENKESGEGNVDGLKSALRKERKARRALEKQVKNLSKSQEDADTKDASDLEKAQKELAATTGKTARLAARLLETSLNNEIIAQATKMKFLDVDDAVKLVDRELIDVEQDEDDPGDVTVDKSTVKEALEELTKTKPHLLIAEGSSERSGSKFGGDRSNRDKKDKDAERQEDLSKYPALRGRGSSN